MLRSLSFFPRRIILFAVRDPQGFAPILVFLSECVHNHHT